MVLRKDLEKFLSTFLETHRFHDYGPNGLQVEGCEKISRIGFAVSATRESIEWGVREKFEALIVHHGLLWNFHGVRPFVGPFLSRLAPLIRSHMNLMAYHLPLDAHIEVGNAAALGRRIGLTDFQPFGRYKDTFLGIKGVFPKNATLSAKMLSKKLEKVLSHPVLLSSPDPSQKIKTLGIITGGANSEWTHALSDQLDAYVTGEMSEHDWHEAKESGVHFFAGGHNATESFGIVDLVSLIKKTFDVDVSYYPSSNPA